MPDIFGIILWPIRWLLELVIVAFHSMWSAIGLDPNNGWTWVLSILGLVVVVRSAIIPLTVKQIKSQRTMMALAPEVKKIQDKYKGKRDQFSRQQQQQEMMELYQKHGSSPLAGCWPILVQMPILLALYNVINGAQMQQAGVGAMTQDLSHSFANGMVFGAPLKATFTNNYGHDVVTILAIVMIVLMVVSQFVTQRQIMSKNISEASKQSPMFRQQEMLLYILPLVFAISGFFFPIGLMIYWLISNFWTMVQQYIVVRSMPTPGSVAAKEREARLRAKGKWVEEESSDGAVALSAPKSTQRAQPIGKARAKKLAEKGIAVRGANAVGDGAPADRSPADGDGADRSAKSGSKKR